MHRPFYDIRRILCVAADDDEFAEIQSFSSALTPVHGTIFILLFTSGTTILFIPRPDATTDSRYQKCKIPVSISNPICVALSMNGEWISIVNRHGDLQFLPVESHSILPPESKTVGESQQSMSTLSSSRNRTTKAKGMIKLAHFLDPVATNEPLNVVNHPWYLTLAPGFGQVCGMKWWKPADAKPLLLLTSSTGLISFVHVERQEEVCRCQLDQAGTIVALDLVVHDHKSTHAFVRTSDRKIFRVLFERISGKKHECFHTHFQDDPDAFSPLRVTRFDHAVSIFSISDNSSNHHHDHDHVEHHPLVTAAVYLFGALDHTSTSIQLYSNIQWRLKKEMSGAMGSHELSEILFACQEYFIGYSEPRHVLVWITIPTGVMFYRLELELNEPHERFRQLDVRGQHHYIITSQNVYTCTCSWSKLLLFQALSSRQISLATASAFGHVLQCQVDQMFEIVADGLIERLVSDLCSGKRGHSAPGLLIEWIQQLYAFSSASPFKVLQKLQHLTHIDGYQWAFQYGQKQLQETTATIVSRESFSLHVLICASQCTNLSGLYDFLLHNEDYLTLDALAFCHDQLGDRRSMYYLGLARYESSSADVQEKIHQSLFPLLLGPHEHSSGGSTLGPKKRNTRVVSEQKDDGNAHHLFSQFKSPLNPQVLSFAISLVTTPAVISIFRRSFPLNIQMHLLMCSPIERVCQYHFVWLMRTIIPRLVSKKLCHSLLEHVQHALDDMYEEQKRKKQRRNKSPMYVQLLQLHWSLQVRRVVLQNKPYGKRELCYDDMNSKEGRVMKDCLLKYDGSYSVGHLVLACANAREDSLLSFIYGHFHAWNAQWTTQLKSLTVESGRSMLQNLVETTHEISPSHFYQLLHQWPTASLHLLEEWLIDRFSRVKHENHSNNFLLERYFFPLLLNRRKTSIPAFSSTFYHTIFRHCMESREFNPRTNRQKFSSVRSLNSIVRHMSQHKSLDFHFLGVQSQCMTLSSGQRDLAPENRGIHQETTTAIVIFTCGHVYPTHVVQKELLPALEQYMTQTCPPTFYRTKEWVMQTYLSQEEQDLASWSCPQACPTCVMTAFGHFSVP